jgi:hypothetical protein
MPIIASFGVMLPVDNGRAACSETSVFNLIPSFRGAKGGKEFSASWGESRCPQFCFRQSDGQAGSYRFVGMVPTNVRSSSTPEVFGKEEVIRFLPVCR